jgi:hypothetical protein
VLVVVLAIIVLSLTVAYYLSNPSATTNPDNRLTETLCIYPSTNSTMTYHVGTMPLCPTTATTTAENISLQGFSLCPTDCVYPSPYLSGLIIVNGTVPLSQIIMYVNGTYNGNIFQNPSTRTAACTGSANETCTVKVEGTCVSNPQGQTSCTNEYASCFIEQTNNSCVATVTQPSNTLTEFDLGYKGSLPNNVPAIANDSYVITCIATFEDNARANATTVVIAS